MKTLFAPLSLAGVLASLLVTIQPVFAQGGLTPPGAPAPTMKTLSQVEPRTIVNAANTPGDSGDTFIISQPGSYYLTTNIAGVSGQTGIEITTNNVTLDLGGFALQGAPGSFDGIDIPGAQNNIAVRNGSVADWGGNGVSSDSASSANIVFERLNVSSNGGAGIALNGPGDVIDCNSQTNQGDGIDFSGGVISGCTASANVGVGINVGFNADVGFGIDSTSVAGCTADYNGVDGIDAYECSVSGCNALENSGTGISGDESVVSACTASGNGGDGIFSYYSTVSGCSVTFNTTKGIFAENSTVSGCLVFAAQSSSGYGIYVSSPFTPFAASSSITGNTCITAPGKRLAPPVAGIYINASTNRIEGNQIVGNFAAGIQVGSGFVNNVIIKNSVAGSGANNYVVPAGNDLGPVGTAATSTSPWANISH